MFVCSLNTILRPQSLFSTRRIIKLRFKHVIFSYWLSSSRTSISQLRTIFANISVKVYIIKLSIGPRQANLVLIAYASSEGSGEPVHPGSLPRTSAARLYKQ